MNIEPLIGLSLAVCMAGVMVAAKAPNEVIETNAKKKFLRPNSGSQE